MAAPEGNKFAIGNNGGRPPKYDSPKKMGQVIDDYFEYIQGEYDDEAEQYTRFPEPATITGLALYLGFSGRQGLDAYEDKEEFFDIIKRGRARVEYEYEKSLHSKHSTGAIFALKNMGWKDQSQKEITGPGGGPLGLLTIKKVDGSKPPTDEQ